jgi:aspartate/methionine/tyrosine aminotransferase
MSFNAQAVELNDTIGASNPHVLTMLSERGKSIYFPKQGILAQTAQAFGKEINATIGTALEDSGAPMCLDSIAHQITGQSKQVFAYAPSFGLPAIRTAWKDMLYKKNPSLFGSNISLPVVTSALTHGLSMVGYLFADPGDTVLLPDLYWENYDLVFNHAYGASLQTYPAFINGAYNVAGLRQMLANTPAGKKIVLLNFPNNPTGYTVTIDEAHAIRDTLIESALAGNDLVVLIDDAYFGLVFENGILKESLFAFLANAHERIIAIKFDGPTKEDYVWGFRVGFVTFGCKNASPGLYTALEAKLAGAIRGNISNASNLSQALLLAAYRDTSYEQEKKAKFNVLKQRYLKMRNIFNEHPEYEEVFLPLPFNSGYFMCIRLHNGNAENVRRILLERYSTGIIAMGDIIRIAFSSTPYDMLEKMMANIYNAARESAKVE